MKKNNIYNQYSNKFTSLKKNKKLPKIIQTKKTNAYDINDILIKNEIKNLNKQMKTLKIYLDELKNKK